MWDDFFNNPEIWSIIWITLRMTFTSTLISAVLGVPFGLFLESKSFFGKSIVVSINRTFMALPPVVVGIVVFLLLMRQGPFGDLGWLFTFNAMIVAQVILITPIISGMVYTVAVSRSSGIRAFAKTMGANRLQTTMLVMKELSNEIYFAIIAGFGRAMSEVGAILIVGGNIRHHTRTMTTAISLMRNTGDFNPAIVLGVYLMVIVFLVEIIGNLIRRKEKKNNDNF